MIEWLLFAMLVQLIAISFSLGSIAKSLRERRKE
jgi:hypothetical protein